MDQETMIYIARRMAAVGSVHHKKGQTLAMEKPAVPTILVSTSFKWSWAYAATAELGYIYIYIYI